MPNPLEQALLCCDKIIIAQNHVLLSKFHHRTKENLLLAEKTDFGNLIFCQMFHVRKASFFSVLPSLFLSVREPHICTHVLLTAHVVFYAKRACFKEILF